MAMLRAVILLASFSLTAMSQTYPAKPWQQRIGSLYCGIRMYSATQIQGWCAVSNGSGGWSYPLNSLVTVDAGSMAPIGITRGGDSIFWTFNNGNQTVYPISMAAVCAVNCCIQGIILDGAPAGFRLFYASGLIPCPGP